MVHHKRSPWRRVLRYGLLAVLLLQMPFVYQVCRTWQVDRYLATNAPLEPLPTPFADLRGSLHVHSAAGSHSLGTYPEILAAARQAGYRYLLLTEHPKDYSLFQPLDDPDVLMIYGWELERPDGTRELVDPERRLRIWSDFKDGPVPDDVNGIELFNLADSAASRNHPAGWVTWLYHRVLFPDLFGLHAWELDPGRFRIWDDATRRRALAAVAGNDAHQNLGILVVTGDGKRLLSLFVDPYFQSLSFVTNHAQIPRTQPVSRESVIEALATGASYICFERLGDPTGFSFHAENGNLIVPMGAPVPAGARLVFQAPRRVRFRLIRDGVEHLTLEGRRFSLDAAPGIYRLEVYLLDAPPLISGKPWILSNPLYVR